MFEVWTLLHRDGHPPERQRLIAAGVQNIQIAAATARDHHREEPYESVGVYLYRPVAGTFVLLEKLDANPTRITDLDVEHYHAGRSEALRKLQAAGVALVPGLRLSDCPIAAIVRHMVDDEAFALYVASLKVENRTKPRRRLTNRPPNAPPPPEKPPTIRGGHVVDFSIKPKDDADRAYAEGM